MNFLIISHVIHTEEKNKIYGYGPYVKEMNLWLKHVDKVTVVSPMREGAPDTIDLAYNHKKLKFVKVPSFNLLTLKSKISTIFSLPYIFVIILMNMKKADHIHLRSPGNMGLLGAIAQMFFPKKIKTVKYAGNWDPDSIQPKSYTLQKFIVSNTVLSKNIKVLAYGAWPNQSENIKTFFTASYSVKEIKPIVKSGLYETIQLVFVGTLSENKRPLIALKAAHKLLKLGFTVKLDLMGEGKDRKILEAYIQEHQLAKYIKLHGNQHSSFVKEKLEEAHFLILMSKSEGWPKVVAEAMFFGCIPISSKVSCVNYMIGEGSRGSLVNADALSVVNAIEVYLKNPKKYKDASTDAMQWSRQFTLESFEEAIEGILSEK